MTKRQRDSREALQKGDQAQWLDQAMCRTAEQRAAQPALARLDRVTSLETRLEVLIPVINLGKIQDLSSSTLQGVAGQVNRSVKAHA